MEQWDLNQCPNGTLVFQAAINPLVITLVPPEKPRLKLASITKEDIQLWADLFSEGCRLHSSFVPKLAALFN